MSNASAVHAHPPHHVSAARYFRTPKGLLIVVLAIVAALAASGPGPSRVAPSLAVAIAVAMAIDAPILRWRKGIWEFPDGALLTGMIVAMVLSATAGLQVVAVATAVAVVSKYLLRGRSANVFNPAALALVATYPIYHPPQDWWGAMPEITPLALAVLIVTGVFITERVNKIPALLAFLGSYYLLFTVASFIGSPMHYAEIYRSPDLHAALFFGFFMVTDPPTSPPRAREQIIYGVIVGVTSYAIFELIGAVYYLPAGLLVGNLYEAARRWRAHRRRSGGPIRSD